MRGDEKLGELVVAFAVFGIGTAFIVVVALLGLLGYAVACWAAWAC